MIILAIKTDQPESQFTLLDGHKELASVKYVAHYDLGRTIHLKIHELLKSQKMDWSDINGIVGFKGPGSFTGLRIGLTVANSLANGLSIPIVGTAGKDWLKAGVDKLLEGHSDNIVLPEYGAEPHITKPKK